jgi:2-aminobenzoate-CoA ligase
MATRVEMLELVQAAPERTFQTFADFANTAHHISGIISTEVLTEGPIGIGSRFRETRRMFGREASEEMEVTIFDPPKSYSLRAFSHGTEYRTRFEFTPENGATMVKMIFEARPQSFMAKFMALFMGGLAKRTVINMIRQDLLDGKAAAESQNTSAPAEAEMSDVFLPGDGQTAHKDTFARDNLPPTDAWPRMDYSTVPELAAYPDRLNAAVELLDKAVTERGWGERTMFHYDDARWTYADFKAKADAIARVLVEDMGLVTGNRVLLRGPNNPMMAACWMAVAKAGGVIVATMPLLRARELAYMVGAAQIDHFLCDINLAEEGRKLVELEPRLREVRYFTPLGDGSDADADLDTAIGTKPQGFDNVDTAADDMALIAFTSGTTGQPKGTMHFHRDILAMCDCFPRYVYKSSADDIYVGTPPLAFTFGLGAQLCFPMRSGSAVVYYGMIRDYGCTTLYTAPTMFRVLADKIKAERLDFPTLTQAVSAGETLPLPTFEAFEEATGIKIIDGLGSTEMIHIFVSSEGDNTRPGATGKAIAGYEACIMDEDGNILEPPCDGLIATRGPTGCRYLNNPERQAGYVRNGWNLPGDRYRQDEDGYFWYVARADDMIISAGYNIGGPEVEDALLDHPKVKECAVVASPHPERGHIVKAFVMLRDPADAGDGTVKELQDFVKAQIAPFKYPRAVEFVDDLPRTETGKVQRFKLRQQEEEAAQARE